MSEPTEKQLTYLKRLKYAGPPPKTMNEASVLIDASKEKQSKAKLAGKEYRGLTATQAEKALEKEHRNWLKERRREIRDQMKDDLADQREFERDMRNLGGVERRDELAGWLLRIGKDCAEAKHLEGLLVTVNDANADADLLPPYETCRTETCVCDVEPIKVCDVPRGTRIAERDSGTSSAPSASSEKLSSSNPAGKSKSGCMILLLLSLSAFALIYTFSA